MSVSITGSDQKKRIPHYLPLVFLVGLLLFCIGCPPDNQGESGETSVPGRALAIGTYIGKQNVEGNDVETYWETIPNSTDLLRVYLLSNNHPYTYQYDSTKPVTLTQDTQMPTFTTCASFLDAVAQRDDPGGIENNNLTCIHYTGN